MTSKDKLTETFDLLLSEMNQLIQRLNRQGGEMFTKENYSELSYSIHCQCRAYYIHQLLVRSGYQYRQ